MAAKKFYAVADGRVPGIYANWPAAQQQVDGFAGARFKGFGTRTEAEAWLRAAASKPARPPVAAQPRQPPQQAAGLREGLRAENVLTRQVRASLAAGQTVVFTDGGCDPNPGRGGYGVVLLQGDTRQELAGGRARSTNNRMELLACIGALDALPNARDVLLLCDSSYVVDGFSKGWAVRWRAQGWQRREGSTLVPAANADLWARLLDTAARHRVTMQRVAGHAGIAENERCDELATAALRARDLPPDPGFVG